jgi:P pilus assembly chaperone PapD
MIRPVFRTIVAAVALGLPVAAAQSALQLSHLIVELQPGKHDRQDVEVANDGPEDAYVEIDPREIVDPGKPSESARQDADPQKLGLLVSPARLILQAGQRRLIRIATLDPTAQRERVYRVTVKPVVGKLTATQSGLKVLLGWDMLVLVRPTTPNVAVSATRNGNSITFYNDGNESIVLTDGRQCASPGQCIALADKRLYVGASWTEQLKGSAPVEYTVESADRSDRKRF